jgi:hypothetical protein
MALALDDIAVIPVSSELHVELVRRFPRNISSVVEDVVWNFLDRTEEDFNASQKAPKNGIHWDTLFLPSGTKLRTKYFGDYKYADIKGDKIIYEDKSVPSVSQLAQQMRDNTSVNAWLHMEVMRPGDREWLKANALRS